MCVCVCQHVCVCVCVCVVCLHEVINAKTRVSLSSAELRSCVKEEVDMGRPSLIVPTVYVDVKQR